MKKVLLYIKKNWLLLLLGGILLGWFLTLIYSGNRFCDCAHTETYRDGTTRGHSSARAFYRYYHK